MPRPLEEAKIGDTVLIRSLNTVAEAEVHRFTRTQIVVKVNNDMVTRGFSETKFYKKNGQEVGNDWHNVELPTPLEWGNFQRAVKRHNIIKKLAAFNWKKLTLETLEGIERIATCEENKIK